MGTEERLIVAAVEQFKIHGFNGATTKAIAAEAGFAEVTLFRYFGDKQTLFLKAAGYVGEKFGLMNIPNVVSGDFRQDIVRMCQGLLRHFITQNSLIRMLIFEVMKYEDTRKVLTDIRRKAMENILLLVGKYHNPGEGGRAMEVTEWLMSSLIGSSLCFGLFHDGGEPDAFIRLHAGITADAYIDKIMTAGK